MARQIAVSAVAGAGLEIIFGDFLKMVLKARKNNSQFEPSLKRLEEMLNDMTPNIKRIDSFNRELDQPEQLERLKGLVTKGNDLVSKCSKIHNYNYLKRPIYNKKLLKLEKDIRDHISSVLQLQVVADTKESLHTQNSILVAVKGVSSGVRQSNDQIGKSINGGRVDSSKSYSNTILAGVCSPPLLKVDPVGLEIPLSDLRIKLLNDETSQHIVLSAPGGCGKTTLATALCQQGDVKGTHLLLETFFFSDISDKFKSNILFVNVPKLRNLMIIVKMIFQHKEIESPDFRSEEDAANHLERLFQQIGPDPILLVLDDVWPVSESILDMLKFRIENYKILVTSRYEFRSFGSTYKLKTLNPADAMTLFQKLALPRDQLSYAPDHHILEEMVKWCRGFPLVISVVGKSLCRKSAAEWRKRHRECSKAVSILSDYDKILDCLQSSVEAFNDDVVAKECFMDLGSFPEDQRIPATTLIDMKDANEDDGSYNEHFVTQHDLLRELAIRESNSRSIEHRKRVLLEIIENKIPEWLMEQDQLSIRAKLLSISTDEKFSSSWSTMQAPEVEVLLLNFQTEKFSLPEFIERMNKLKVLVLHNYGFVPAELSNFPLLGSLSNLKRIRLEKVSIPSLFLTSMKWRKLEKMSLVMCNIDQAFNKSTNKISDAFPKLVELTIDYCNDLEELPTGFCDLVLLRKLRITNCHKLLALPEDMGNLLDLEVLRLNSCIELTGLPGSIGRLHKLQILDLSECLSVTELPEQIGQLHDLRKLYMIECSSCELPSSVENLVRLKEVIGDQETAMSWNRFKPCLPSLTIKHQGQIAVSAVAGAGLEIIFGDFLKMVLKARKNNSQFEPSLKRLEEKLKDMDPNIKRIESFNGELDQPEQLERLKGLVTKGNDLVIECSKIHEYNYLKRPIYNKKLLKLEKDIRDHISSVLQLQMVADTKESLHTQHSTLLAVKAVSSGVRQLNDQIGKLSMTLSNGVDPVGLEIPLSDLRIKLLNDETSQHIVLSAPGGCGKTTLATALCQHGDVKAFFFSDISDKFKSNIFFVNVPKLRNLMVIVKMIFQHKEIELPDFRSEEDAANHLERLFQQIGPDPILLVLDDVWPVSESILDMLKFRIENYKILVTSRYEFRSFGSTYKLKTLNPADAMTLFQKLALPRDQQSYGPDHHILEEMVKYCRGFPLVISVVGKSLRRKSAAEWRKRLRECSKAVSILSDYDKILDCLQSSVEALDDNVAAKECFMDLGSFPEDQRIPATTLIDMWAELYNLDEDDAISNLHKLSEMNLIEILVTRKDANEDDGSYNEHFVTQHDLLRELAIRESNSRSIEHRKRVLLEIIENKIPEWLMEQDQLSIRAKLLSISTGYKSLLFS
ncbi:hypothetical protein POTOM_026950 [Populus tomentosa]|uniref:RPW8 domain-containing protein n=1 Tax=Populus tomentosa TaxID=118781 RepID=A0A8X7ZAL6_POPTO|nr:hypothetical protein POTOM_026950 [Populus tomentosa]